MLSDYLKAVLEDIGKVMGLRVDGLRKLLELMHDDPKLRYLEDFWLRGTPGIEKLQERSSSPTVEQEEPAMQTLASLVSVTS